MQLFKQLESSFKEEEGPDRLWALINQVYEGGLDKFALKYVHSGFGYGLGPALLFLRMDFAQEVGGFDENYKIGGLEDVDLVDRLKMVGYKTVTTWNSFIHHCGMITRLDNPRATEAEIENGKYFTKKFSNPNLNPRENWL